MADTTLHGKENTHHVEYLKGVGQSSTQYARFGSFAKVDPKEITLVRKIDLYMMVWSTQCLWDLCPFQVFSADSLADVLLQLPRSQCTESSNLDVTGTPELSQKWAFIIRSLGSTGLPKPIF
ncbi:hypothetical protein ETB97_009786 [Aspergillus alliaceus]|uniref:Uncharacterized protein n=1 Tax=Petromyces alliaceus TaxID=209559 RepID=A0A8H6A883_PETAA|nr:hypothetical protein ETB97_009786 [Aspergillus burnettii]